MLFFFFLQIVVCIHAKLRNAEVMTCMTFLLRLKTEIYLSKTSQGKKKKNTPHWCYTHTHVPKSQPGWGWKWPLRGIFSNSPAPAQAPRAGCSGHVLVFLYIPCLYRMHSCAPSICDIQFLLESSSSAIMDQLSKPTVRLLGKKHSLRTPSLQLILI